MSTGLKEKGNEETPRRSIIGRGRFTITKGNWYCECDRAARCLTTKKNWANPNRRFWRCANVNDEQCSFFLWVDDEPAAKEWLEKSQLQPAPHTPTQTVIHYDAPDRSATTDVGGRDSLTLSPEAPFTKAKRKQVAIDIAEHPAGRTLDKSEAQGALPRKVSKASTLSTPGQRFTEKLKNGTASLPTPDSREHRAASCNTDPEQRQLQLLDTSPTPGRFRDAARPALDAESDLTTTILELIRSDNLELKATTEIQLRHEVDLQLDMGAAKEHRHKETISRLCKRVDELETMVLQLTK